MLNGGGLCLEYWVAIYRDLCAIFRVVVFLIGVFIFRSSIFECSMAVALDYFLSN